MRLPIFLLVHLLQPVTPAIKRCYLKVKLNTFTLPLLCQSMFCPRRLHACNRAGCLAIETFVSWSNVSCVSAWPLDRVAHRAMARLMVQPRQIHLYKRERAA